VYHSLSFRSEKIARTETVIGALNTNSTTVADDIIDAINITENMSISDPVNFKSDGEFNIYLMYLFQGEICLFSWKKVQRDQQWSTKYYTEN
jgi:hypothetical protein